MFSCRLLPAYCYCQLLFMWNLRNLRISRGLLAAYSSLLTAHCSLLTAHCYGGGAGN